MVLQERDYTKFISEEEKSAFELECCGEKASGADP